ncbi:MAG: EipA family protein, partial [Rhodospirillales bacterium]
MRLFSTLFACVLAAAVATATPAHAEDTYSQEEIMAKARGFFGSTTKGLAEAIQKVFADKGQPNAVILGEEASGAIGIGLRYGE